MQTLEGISRSSAFQLKNGLTEDRIASLYSEYIIICTLLPAKSNFCVGKLMTKGNQIYANTRGHILIICFTQAHSNKHNKQNITK